MTIQEKQSSSDELRKLKAELKRVTEERNILKEAAVFFALLKRERIRCKIYRSREEGKADVFNYIELLYNPTRRHGNNNDLSPMKYEKNYFLKQSSV